MAYENLLVEKRDGIAFITFNRPKVLNALNRKTVEELRAALVYQQNFCGCDGRILNNPSYAKACLRVGVPP